MNDVQKNHKTATHFDLLLVTRDDRMLINYPLQAPSIVSPLSDETVMAGRSVQLKCMINSDASPPPVVEWSKDGLPLNIDRAFTSLGEESCVLRIQMVERDDEGIYTCTVANKKGVVSSSAKVTVMSPPDPPNKPLARPLTSTSVSLSWTPPTFVGHSPITIYLVECKDVVSDRYNHSPKYFHNH